MPETVKATRRGKLRDYLICYGLYALLIAFAFYAAIIIWPNTLLALILVLTDNRYASRAGYPFIMLIFGLAWLVLLLAAEPYLRNGVARQVFWPRFARLAIPILLAGALGWLLGWALVSLL